MTAEKMFNQYKVMKRELSVLQFQLSRFQGITSDEFIRASTFSHQDGERVQTSGTSDKTGKLALNYRQVIEKENDEWYDFLLKRYEYIHEEIDFFEYVLNKIENGDVIREMIVDEVQWNEIESTYCLSHSTLGRYRKKAIEDIDRLYELRDQQTESYILG